MGKTIDRKIVKLFTIDDEVITDPQNTAEFFRNYFVTVAENLEN